MIASRCRLSRLRWMSSQAVTDTASGSAEHNAPFPSNVLEESLQEAANKHSARRAFYNNLLNEDVVAMTDGSTPETNEQGGTPLRLVTMENGKVPMFTSVSRMYDKGAIDAHTSVPYVQLPGRVFLSAAPQASYVVNPFSDWGKELVPSEVQALLDGSLFAQLEDDKQQQRIRKGTTVVFGPAKKDVHRDLVDNLSALFKRHSNVKAAYLAQMEIARDGAGAGPQGDDEGEQVSDAPHLMVGVDAEGSVSEVTDEAIPVVERAALEGIVDFCRIDANDGISDYFRNAKPFYERD